MPSATTERPEVMSITLQKTLCTPSRTALAAVAPRGSSIACEAQMMRHTKEFARPTAGRRRAGQRANWVSRPSPLTARDHDRARS